MPRTPPPPPPHGPGQVDPVDFERELRALAAEDVELGIVLNAYQAWMLFSQLQLVLKHPANTGPAYEFGLTLAHTLEAEITPTPALKAVAAQGWEE